MRLDDSMKMTKQLFLFNSITKISIIQKSQFIILSPILAASKTGLIASIISLDSENYMRLDDSMKMTKQLFLFNSITQSLNLLLIICSLL